VLDTVLGKLARQQDPRVLVGFDTADDAGVYQLSGSLALVQTVDFFTPIVDDPYVFGQIAATNALSDVYAMGGQPMTALAMVCFPEKGDLDVLERVLAGGLSKMIEAGCTVIGGHSIRDEELKFGYAVTGQIHPQQVLANVGARPGDRLLLTKALGTGVISTAIKRGKAEQAWIDAAAASMTTLNKRAAELIAAGVSCAREASPRQAAEMAWSEVANSVTQGAPPAFNAAPSYRVHAMTDVTGFGLIGHAREMALGSKVSLRLFASRVPVLPGAMECIRERFIPGGLKANRDFAECLVGYDDAVAEELRTILYDPQTAGGLLVSVAGEDAERLRRDLNSAHVPAVEIGEVLEEQKPTIRVEL
jgi:selenide,water dikinase